MDLENWMSQYQSRTLGEMHLPGSHDAGTARHYIDKTAFGTNSNAATQDLTITEQLGIGTRFFDVRLKSKGGQVVAHHTTAKQGAYSTIAVDNVIAEAAQFCEDHPTEVVIFRISHTSLSTDAHEIVKANGGGQLHTGTGNLVTKRLKDIVAQGGGLICIFDQGKFGGVIDQASGVHGFCKYEKKASNHHGISACGCYSRTHTLHSVMCNGLRGQYEHNELHEKQSKHLWQVYWQKTYVNPASTTGIEDGAKKGIKFKDGEFHGGTHAATRRMLKMMQGMRPLRQGEDYEVVEAVTEKQGKLKRKVVVEQAVMYSTLPVRNYSLPNVISYDFVNPRVNKRIIRLNEKNLQGFSDNGEL